MYEHLQGNSLATTAGASTLSAVDSLAKTLATPAGVQESTAVEAGCGLSLPGLLATFDPSTSSWRTSQLCLGEEWEGYLATWPRAGLMRNGIAFLQTPLVCVKLEIGVSSWPTLIGGSSLSHTNGRSCVAKSHRHLLSTGNLSPTECELLSGLPMGWTLLDESRPAQTS